MQPYIAMAHSNELVQALQAAETFASATLLNVQMHSMMTWGRALMRCCRWHLWHTPASSCRRRRRSWGRRMAAMVTGGWTERRSAQHFPMHLKGMLGVLNPALECYAKGFGWPTCSVLTGVVSVHKVVVS